MASRVRSHGERGEDVSLAVGVRARGADEVEHAGVGALDALHELQRLEQLREAVGVQHDGDEIGLVAHVALAQQPAELDAHLGEPVAQPGDAALGLAELGLRRSQTGVGGVELALRLVEPALEHADLAPDLALERAEPRGGVRQRLLLLLARADLVAQRALALPARGCRRDGGDQQSGDER